MIFLRLQGMRLYLLEISGEVSEIYPKLNINPNILINYITTFIFKISCFSFYFYHIS